jgi:hypothetical protein
MAIGIKASELRLGKLVAQNMNELVIIEAS